MLTFEHPKDRLNNLNMNTREIISLKDISRFYEVGTETVKALNGIDLSIHKNEFVAMMGPSGSGKSTVMNILGCLDTPTRGSYFLNDVDVSKMTDSELAEVRNREIGFIFQTFNLLLRSTALENVVLPLIYAGYPKHQRIEMAKEALEHVQLGDRINHRPNELSGGQRQRVAIARALVNNPSIVLADEPTGNLDSKTSVEIMGLLEEIHGEGNTIILVTHEPDIALHAHRIVRLMDGEIEHDELNDNIVKVGDTMMTGA